jgi:predicted dehydrogenase
MRKLRMGMVGGGPGAFIGAIHRTAAAIDAQIELVAGAFSSDPEKSKQQGEKLFLDPHRVYGSYKEMIASEKDLPEDKRIDIVSIVTPNHVHFDPARLALENGFHVVLDKPITYDLAEARQLQKLIKETGKYFLLTHTYTGYPMVKQAKQLVKEGRLGKIRKVLVTYPQGWLSYKKEASDNNIQASWRTDPLKSGKAGCIGDIGTHAFNLAEYVTGLQVTKICADINTIVEGRQLDDDGAVLLKFNNGASGILIASQVFTGEENDFSIKVYGDKAGLEWKHSDPNTLLLKETEKPMEVWRAGTGYIGSYASHNTRTPAGHPEGYIEAFANLYRNFALCVQASLSNEKPREEWLDFPGAEEGIRGMAFIDAVIASGESTDKWMEFSGGKDE